MTTKLSTVVLLSLVGMVAYLPQASAVSPGLQLDGVARGGSIFSNFCRCFLATTASLSTTRADDVVVVVAQCAVFISSCNDTITSVSDSEGHAWTVRAAYIPTNGRPIWEYYTVASSPLLSDRINASWSGSDPFGFAALAISGADIQHPWDRGLPVQQALGAGCGLSCGTITIPTTAAQDFVIVSAASTNHCGNVAMFRSLAYLGGGGEVDYLITSLRGAKPVTFSCDGYGETVTLLGDALRSQTAPTLGLDGVGVGANTVPCCYGSRQSQLLTTTRGHDVVVLVVETCCHTTISVNDSSRLSFTQRLVYASHPSYGCKSCGPTFWEYYATATSPLMSDNITVVAPGSSIVGMQAFAIMGANTRTVFDPNSSIPATVSCPSLGCGDCTVGQGICSTSIQTSTIDFVVAATAINDAPPCGPNYRIGLVPGFESLVANPNSNFEIDFTITTVPQPKVVFNCNGTDAVAIVVDAISFHSASGTG